MKTFKSIFIFFISFYGFSQSSIYFENGTGTDLAGNAYAGTDSITFTIDN